MNLDRAGALALLAGAIAYAALMAVHPSHAGGQPVIGSFSLSGVVHATALVMKPVLVFGFVIFSRHLGFERPLVLLAVCFYALAATFTMLAGTMSGLMFPYIVEAAHAEGADIADIQMLGRYTTWLNRSFAQVHFDLASIGILLWGLGWPAKTIADWIGRAIAVLVGAGVIVWQLSGTMTFEARQGSLWITLAHALFFLFAAAALWRGSASADQND